jgi:hypothetical protein
VLNGSVERSGAAKIGTRSQLLQRDHLPGHCHAVHPPADRRCGVTQIAGPQPGRGQRDRDGPLERSR